MARTISSVRLRISRDGDDDNQLVSPDTPYVWARGEKSAEVRLPWKHEKIASHLEQLNYRKGVEISSDLRRDTLSEIGDRMADILGQAPGLIRDLKEQSARGDRLMHLELEMSAQELAMLPFELSKVPSAVPGSRDSWLTVQTDAPLTLTHRLPGVQPAPISWDRPPRVLFAWSDAGGRVQHQEHKEKLVQALAPWRSTDGEVPLVELPRASAASLQEKLEDAGEAASFTHVHILAHGEEADHERGFTLALFHAEGQTKQSVGRQALANVLCPSRLEKRHWPAVITLASCDSASVGSVVRRTTSIGQELHRRGIPLVVASRFRLTAPGALTMVEHLYGGLLAGEDPRFVLHELRKRLFSDAGDDHDWASLVCFASFPADLDAQVEAVRGSAGASDRGVDESFLPAYACSSFEDFDHGVVQCVVVSSESELQAKELGERKITLYTQTGRACRRSAGSISDLCRAYWARRRPAAGTGQRRRFDPERKTVVVSEVPVTEVFKSWQALDRAVRAMCWADIAIFDLSGFEPGVMTLLGIRAAVRRGLSLCSLWREDGGRDAEKSVELELPFNIQNLTWSARGTRRGYEKKLARLIKQGFAELDELPHYLDLPAFDSLRILGTSSKSARSISPEEKVLMLCPFSHEYTRRNYDDFLRPELSALLEEGTAIERLGDDRSPRVISQKLYEAIRRTEMCIVDWTLYRPNVFVELGVRLAISNLGAVQILQEPENELSSAPEPPGHVEDMKALFQPIRYRCIDGEMDAYDEMLAAFEASKDDLGALEGDPQRVYRTVADAIAGSGPGHEPVHAYLSRAADLLHGRDQQSEGFSQVLFVENRAVKRDTEAAARELRLAAWLYLEHRLQVAESKDPELVRQYIELGDLVASSLVSRRASDRDKQLGRTIYQKVQALKQEDSL